MLPKLGPSTLMIANLATVSPALEARNSLCEPLERICYGGAQGGMAQNIDKSDIEYVASFLRHHGRKNNALYAMPSSFSCEEWTISTPGSGTVLALAKHVNPRTASSVTFEDIANTIDGGENASEAAKTASLLGCGEGGGSLGVKADPKHPLYNTTAYRNSKSKPQDIIVKLVRNPNYQPEKK